MSNNYFLCMLLRSVSLAQENSASCPSQQGSYRYSKSRNQRKIALHNCLPVLHVAYQLKRVKLRAIDIALTLTLMS